MFPIIKSKMAAAYQSHFLFSLNRADLLQKRGLNPPPPGQSEKLGLEVSGVIAGIGPGVQGSWKLGNKVMALLGGGAYAEYVMPVPSQLTLSGLADCSPTSASHYPMRSLGLADGC
ncbi:quinone oxidoreductase PIG3 [Triplophysa dalaica]|uniref:quinone oxidoreductase PIG3 n=1 Tax=Triplophysa dalaica TaxID=1582913 RepID=UPI0024DFE32B|nr:quinone oxidoreductase PIG3 [Triplophysa dalaica]